MYLKSFCLVLFVELLPEISGQVVTVQSDKVPESALISSEQRVQRSCSTRSPVFGFILIPVGCITFTNSLVSFFVVFFFVFCSGNIFSAFAFAFAGK